MQRLSISWEKPCCTAHDIPIFSVLLFEFYITIQAVQHIPLPTFVYFLNNVLEYYLTTGVVTWKASPSF